MTSRLMSVPIDCTHPVELAGFWAEVLGWRIRHTGFQRTEHGPDGAVLSPPDGLGIELDFRWVPDPKTTKNRLHLDINPVDRDQDAELERLLGLGATRVDVGQGERPWHVLADPEGNEFCLCHDRVTATEPRVSS
jgi:hypothetical protein